MMPLYNQQYDYILLYVPKAACSLLRKIYVCLHEEEFTKEQKDLLQSRSHHVIGSIHNGNKLPLDKMYSTKKLLVCRSPYTRTLSSYYDKFINILRRKNNKAMTFYNLLQFYSHTQCIDKLRSTVNFINSNKITNGLTLNEIYDMNNLTICNETYNDSFLSYLEFVDTCNQNNIICYDEHHKPQTFINKNNVCKIKFFANANIFQLENNINNNLFDLLKPFINQKLLNSKKKDIKNILNSKDTNSTPPKKYFESVDCSNYTLQQIDEIYNTTKCLPDIKNMLCNPRINELINKIYHDDFLYLKYNKNN